jgi:hypothetical protein
MVLCFALLCFDSVVVVVVVVVVVNVVTPMTNRFWSLRFYHSILFYSSRAQLASHLHLSADRRCCKIPVLKYPEF